MTTISDLSWDLVGEIFSRVPLTSLSAVRSTCKTWKALSKNQILGRKSAKKQFMAFVMIEHHYSIYSLRFEIQGIRNENYCYDEDLGKHISMPSHQVEISKADWFKPKTNSTENQICMFSDMTTTTTTEFLYC
ncbi:hypothetical protein Bca4012_030076 [Brassica carinata]|uniref:F-box domain-containing protein n=1 Tax=Brassica oleracea TaxID=3712 RepID=A0A3P6C0V1_BRAOL|nr:unnamed protein product [Brassica oleracea]